MLSILKNIKSCKTLLVCVFALLICISIIQVSSKQLEHFRIRSLLEVLPRFKGRAYSNKLNINYENYQFTCKVADKIYPKEFSFLSNSAYSICSDKIYEEFEPLARKINEQVDQYLELKSLVNVNFLSDFKQILYFAYYLAYHQDSSDSVAKKPVNNTIADEFYDSKKLSFTQKEIFDNLSENNFNIFELNTEDLKIINNYLHTVIDFNISTVRHNINMIIDNIEKAFKKDPRYKNWLIGNSAKIKNFIGIIWVNAIPIDVQ